MIPFLPSLVLAQIIAPHGLGYEDTYTITTTLKVLRPCNPSVMTDPYQDVKVLGDDGKCLTLSVTYFPLNDKIRKLRIQRYATTPGDLGRYLRPTVTANWDPTMKRELIRDLKKDGIDPSKLQKRDLISKVASWAFQTSTFASNTEAMPSDWFVAFPNGRPDVYPPVRKAFEESKTEAGWSDQEVFAHQLLGREMFRARTHGACTSSSIYLSTILRALGIPTRIVYFIPACDGNDPEQIKKLESAVTRGVTRQTMLDGIPRGAGFSNHMFNEVWVDGQWQRLNYSKLGQEIADNMYLGLMTHIDTCADISETHLAETWGMRASRWPDVSPKLTSINPYELVAASDHWVRNSVRDNPAPEVLSEVTVNEVLWPGTPEYKELIPDGSHLPKTDLLLLIREWNPNRNYIQLREFMAHADTHLVLQSPGHRDLPIHYNGLNCSNYRARGYAMCLDAPNALVPGAIYTLVPQNEGAKHHWKVAEGLRITVPAHGE